MQLPRALPLLMLMLTLTFTFALANACTPPTPNDDDNDRDRDRGGEGEGEGSAGEGEGAAGEGEGEGGAVWTCDLSLLGEGDCDCGCGIVDTDCSSSSASVCAFNDCPGGAPVDPNNNALCTQPPDGWLCGAGFYDDGASCDCGCGIADPDCPANATRVDCNFSQTCPDGQSPSPTDITQCIDNPPGWTCNGLFFDDGACDCGCGVRDRDCPLTLTFGDCNGSDLCPSFESPDPLDPTQCIENAPEDSWTCDLALILDGACDCGCGAVDPDCASTDAGACDVNHCSPGDELVPGDIASCEERCDATTTAQGTGTCTNGGSVTFGNACEFNLSACGDGHSYEVECDGGGTCACRVDGACFLRADGFCSSTQGTLDDVCGWSLIDGI